jgi:YhcH/YjgK/YiaL family protein
MIFDKVENVKFYKGISSRLDKALELLTAVDFASKADGKHEVDGDNLFYMVQRYQTKPIAEGKHEAHKKYIDVQLVVSGSEVIGVESFADQKVETPYTEDAGFYFPSKNMTKLRISAGQFCVLYPHDLHMPCRTDSISQDVVKVVIKVKV